MSTPVLAIIRPLCHAWDFYANPWWRGMRGGAGVLAVGLVALTVPRVGRSQITVAPGTGTYISASGQSVPVTVTVCNLLGYKDPTITFDGANVTGQFTMTSSPGSGLCLYQVTATGTVSLVLGANTLSAAASGMTTVTVVYTLDLPPPVRVFSVLPAAQSQTVAPNTAFTMPFTVTNLGNLTDSVALVVPCGTSQAGFTGGCAALATGQASSVTLAAGASATVNTSFTTTATAGVVGIVTLRATSKSNATVIDSGQADITVTAAAAPGIVLYDDNPSNAKVPDICLEAAIERGVAYDCGDLRVAYALPVTTTYSRHHTPTLIYNSSIAHPRPTVTGRITLNGGRPTPDTVKVRITINGVVEDSVIMAGASFPPGATRLVTLGFDGGSFASGSWTYTFSAEVHYNSLELDTTYTASNSLAIVNTTDALPLGGFPLGWTLAGLERLKFYSGAKDSASFEWMSGDGNARYFQLVSTGVWATADPERPDTVKLLNGYYIRYAEHGAQVWFDTTAGTRGRQLYTRDRRGYLTQFTYGTYGLSTITLPTPPGALARAYTFYYDSRGYLDSVVAPQTTVTAQTPAQSRTTAFTVNSAQQVTQITDALSHTVNFTYVSGDPKLLASYTDPRATVATVTYDAGHKLAGAIIDPGSAPHLAITRTYQAAETKAWHTALVADSVYTTLTGPRTVNVERDWLDRWGEPLRIRDALGEETDIVRSGASYPILATRLQAANGRVLRATYDARGNLATETDSSNCRSGSCATTQYVWDQTWDYPTAITLPMGEYWQANYDPTMGNRLTQAVGTALAGSPADTMRVHFFYDAVTTHASWGQLVSDSTPKASAKDSVTYDTLGNVSGVRTPLLSWTYVLNDAIGRRISTYSPTDTVIGGPATRVDSVVFDAADHDTLTIAYSTPTSGSQSFHVRKQYDPGDNLLGLDRESVPDPNNVGWLTTTYTYDALSRRITETPAQNATQHPTPLSNTYAYDAASNDTAWITRAAATIRTSYDALNRVSTKIIPATQPDSVTFVLEGSSVLATYHFPLYPNPGTKTLSIPADTQLFVYDAVGHLVVANNVNAQISRSYDVSGNMIADQSAIRTWLPLSGGGDFLHHVWGDTATYDLEHRRVTLKIPSAIAPQAGLQTLQYGYNTVNGLLNAVEDVYGRLYGFGFDGEQRLAEQVGPNSDYVDQWRYDGEGRLRARVESCSSISVPYCPSSGQLHADTVQLYDLANRERRLSVSSVPLGYPAITVAYSYAPLGALSSWTQGQMSGPSGIQETWSTDALGFRTRETLENKNVLPNTTYGHNSLYEANAGVLEAVNPDVSESYVDYNQVTELTWPNDATKISAFQQWGYISFETICLDYGVCNENGAEQSPTLNRLSYYAYSADERLSVTDTRVCSVMYGSGGTESCLPADSVGGTTAGAYEEYRYDALGRRVLVRARQDSTCIDPSTTFYGAGCHSTIDRYLWDGDRVLAEIRMPAWDSTPTDSLERDTTTVWYDPYAPFGRVLYIHAIALNRLLGVVRTGYTNYGFCGWHTHRDTAFTSWAQPILFVPHYDYRAEIDGATTISDQGFDEDNLVTPTCPSGAVPQQPIVAYTDTYQDLFHAGNAGAPEWFGSLLTHATDASGLQYKRNRYYDALQGQFTQQDPIGLAGGLNAYGFANGDPVNYSDPFGLCSEADNYTNCSPRSAAGSAAVFNMLAAKRPMINAATAQFVGLSVAGAVAGAFVLPAAEELTVVEVADPVTPAAREAAIQGVKGYNSLLTKLFDTGELPEGLPREVVEQYRTIARWTQQNASKLDKSGEQLRRLRIIDKVLRITGHPGGS
jgi:RHS repeat-associated protein